MDAILAHPAATLEEYRLQRIAEWSQPTYELDKRFTRLTLLLDQGPEAQGERWQAHGSFDDLREALARAPEPAVVLLGPPGCGKSTLLRRLELDLAVDALRSAAADGAPVSFLLPLNNYRSAREGEDPPAPLEWLSAEWARLHPNLPPLPQMLMTGRFVLLLDAINEIPHSGPDEYGRQVKRWRQFLADLASTARGVRVLLSCRSLDYSTDLSTPGLRVPHLRVESLGDPQVNAFLNANSQYGAALWQQLKGTPQLDLFRSPYYLKMLLAQVGPDGTLPAGRAALFSGFVRQALRREIVADNPLFTAGALLASHECGRLIRNELRGTDLPEDSPAVSALAALAFGLQLGRGAGDASRVREKRAKVLALLGQGQAEQLLHAGIALQVLEEKDGDVFYAHQLLQEYFAGRALSAAPREDLARTRWRADEIEPSLNEVLAGLADSAPLPAAPATGWEETFLLAAAMVESADTFVSALARVNLPLAGRCAAQPDVEVSGNLREELQKALLARSRDPEADLRARIATARSLGQLGDPRFELRSGPHGPYVLSPMLDIEGGEYVIGSDDGHYPDREEPVHRVKLKPLALAQFPLTNAEWRLFMQAGGYEDERWWQGEAAKRWRAGEGTAEGPKAEWRKLRERFQADPDLPQRTLKAGRTTTQVVQTWEWARDSAPEDFERQLDEWYPQGRQTEPAYWNDPAYNHPSQPVVGICWYEARAYCAWLSAQTGHKYRLPSEAEWEAAARGRPVRKWYRIQARGRRYAWGENFDAACCNAFETHVRGTTPVGVFAGGDTPEGLADMTGNVWEWTSSVYQPYPYESGDGREDPESERPRVVRGGSWGGNRLGCRCAYRGDLDPGSRHVVIGLRLCVAPPIK